MVSLGILFNEKKKILSFIRNLSKTREKETVSSSFHEASVSFIPEPDKDVPMGKKNDRPVFFENEDSSIRKKIS